MREKKFLGKTTLWNKVTAWYRYPNKTVWFTFSEQTRRILYKIIGYDSLMINSKTGRAIYERKKLHYKDIIVAECEENNIDEVLCIEKRPEHDNVWTRLLESRK